MSMLKDDLVVWVGQYVSPRLRITDAQGEVLVRRYEGAVQAAIDDGTTSYSGLAAIVCSEFRSEAAELAGREQAA